MPATWVNGGTQDNAVLVSLPSISTVGGLLTANPSRHPLMLNDLLNVYAATVWSIMPGWASSVWCRPRHTMQSYGSSLKTATSRPRINSASPCRSSSKATPPVGLCGLFRKIALGLRSSSRNRRTSPRSGRKLRAALRVDRQIRAPRRAMFAG